MFDLDKWQEILGTVRRHKLRTFLTAFGVFWGIFMLVLLLGVGQGLQNGVIEKFGQGATNSLWVWGERTSMPYQGLQPGRQIIFTNDDLKAIQREVPEVELLAPRNRLWGEFTVSYKNQNGSFQVFGSNAEFFHINGEKWFKGRTLNRFDQLEKRKVAVMGERARQVLFKDEDAIGKYINIKGAHFQVVGIFRTDQNDGRNEERVYVPFSTFQTTFNQYNQVQMFGITTKAGIPAKVLEEKVRNIMATRHKFSPQDEQAIGLNNNEEEHQRFMGLFNGIRLFIWVVGIGTLIAGIVGVSNIMLIIVKERTREIGVRKALGATPFSVVSLIVQESIVLTAASGYFGLLAGVGLLDGIRYMMDKSGAKGGFFSNPGVDVGVVVTAALILVLAGAFAGLMPALRAAQIKPIEALRAD